MHDPERGGSQVPTAIGILLLLVAGAIAYSEHGARVTAEKDLDEILAAACDASTPTKAKKSDAIDSITRTRALCAKQEDRLYEILEVTGGADEETPELVVDPSKLKAVQTRFLEALDKGEFVVETPAKGGMVVTRYGGTLELHGARPDLSNVVDVVVIPAMRRMFADLKRYVDLYGQALEALEAADAKYREMLAAMEAEVYDLRRQKDAAVAALTVERDDWRKKAEQAAAELRVLKQR